MSRRELTIRTAVATDAEAIHVALCQIGVHVGAEHKVTSTPDDIRRHGFGAQARFETLIAEVEGRFAGISLFFPSFSTWRGEPGAYIQDFFVGERFRGEGVAAALIAATARHVHEQGGKYLRLSVDKDNLAAMRFYERVGLRWSEPERIYAVYGEAFAALAFEGQGR